MANFSGKYLKVWKVEDKGSVKLVDLGDSAKNRDGEYDNWTWFKCLFCGSAAQKEINEGDKIEVTSGQIFQEKYEGKYYTKVKVFHFDIMEAAGPQQSEPKRQGFHPTIEPTRQTGAFGGFQPKPAPETFGGGSFEDDIPF